MCVCVDASILPHRTNVCVCLCVCVCMVLAFCNEAMLQDRQLTQVRQYIDATGQKRVSGGVELKSSQCGS